MCINTEVITYNSDEIPENLSRTKPKKAGVNKCKFHRTISMISYTRKLMNRIRDRNIIIPKEAEEQYGFAQDVEIRNSDFIMRMLSQQVIEMQNDCYQFFIDYTK